MLTIIIPTYNRANKLAALLRALRIELAGQEGRISIIIGDNASTDETALLTQEFARDWGDTRVLRHSINVGPEENFCLCLEQANTPYFWIVGDDDLPRAGAIPLLLNILDTQRPDLVYLRSKGATYWARHDQEGYLKKLDAQLMDARAFACSVHVYATFISGLIVNSSFAPKHSLRRFSGSHLVQLGWVLGAIRDGRKFIHVSTVSILGTGGNSGGYGALKVFGNNFPCIAREVFSGSAEHRALAEDMVRRTSVAYLPGLVWSLRQGRLGAFDQKESLVDNLEPQMGRSLAYRLLIRPMDTATPRRAIMLLRIAHVASRLVKCFDLVLMRLFRRVHQI